MPRKDIEHTEFGKMLIEHIKQSTYGTANQFAKAHGTSSGYISAVCTGLRTVNPTNLVPWAVGLGMKNGSTMWRFIALGLLFHCPSPVRNVLIPDLTPPLAKALSAQLIQKYISEKGPIPLDLNDDTTIETIAQEE